jgi:hypothetical protein
MTRAETFLAILKALPPDEFESIRSKVRALAQRKPRNAQGFTARQEEKIDALMKYKLAIHKGATPNAALQLTRDSSPYAGTHFSNFQSMTENRTSRDLHTEANRRIGLLLKGQRDDHET